MILYRTSTNQTIAYVTAVSFSHPLTLSLQPSTEHIVSLGFIGSSSTPLLLMNHQLQSMRPLVCKEVFDYNVVGASRLVERIRRFDLIVDCV